MRYTTKFYDKLVSCQSLRSVELPEFLREVIDAGVQKVEDHIFLSVEWHANKNHTNLSSFFDEIAAEVLINSVQVADVVDSQRFEVSVLFCIAIHNVWKSLALEDDITIIYSSSAFDYHRVSFHKTRTGVPYFAEDTFSESENIIFQFDTSKHVHSLKTFLVP